MSTAADLLAITPLLLGWLACCWLAHELTLRQSLAADWRLTWLWACVGWGTLLTAIVECGSACHILSAPFLRVAWGSSDVLILGTAAALAHRRGALTLAALAGWARRGLPPRLSDWPPETKWMAAATLATVAALFVWAALTPTTNWDSLTYHLPRIMHWAQQKGVQHYPTNIGRQLEIGPWSSFAMLNLYLLQGSDRFLNLVQWFAMVSSLVVLSLVSEQLGTWARGPEEPTQRRVQDLRAAAFTCLLVATLPIGIVESITTQTDYVTAFWLCGLACFTLGLALRPNSFSPALGAGLAFGLGMLTKATTCLYAAPVLALAGPYLLARRRGWRPRLALVAIFAVAPLALNAPHMLRNYEVFGSPIGSKHNFSIERNQRISPAVVASNLIRNLALNANSGVPQLTRALNGILQKAHRLTGEPISDPQTTYLDPQATYSAFMFAETFCVFDSYASNTYHVLLTLIALGLALRRPRANAKLLCYGAVVVAGVVLFCGYLKWQPWHARRHLAYLLLLMPLVARIVADSFPRWAIALAASVLQAFAVFSAAQNLSSPIMDAAWRKLPREQRYLTLHAPDFDLPTVQAADAIVAAGVPSVGLKLRLDDAEYPLWVMLHNRGWRGRIDHVYVSNESALLPAGGPMPPVVVSTIETPPEAVKAAFPYYQAFGPLRLWWAERPPKGATSWPLTGRSAGSAIVPAR